METITEYEAIIGETVRQIRIRKGYALEELAARANLSPTSVRALELGRGSSLSTLLKVLQVLDELDLFTEWRDENKEFSPLSALRTARRQNPSPRRVSVKRTSDIVNGTERNGI